MDIKDVRGYEGYYKVGVDGKVYSTHTYNGRKPTIKKAYLGKRGYYVVDLVKNQKRKNVKVHRLVADAFIPNPYNKPQVNHIDCNKLNNNASNLEWVTNKENVAHAIRSGLVKDYDHVKYAKKLTPELAIKIYKEDGLHKDIAKKYSIGVSTVTHIKRGSRWGKYTKRLDRLKHNLYNARQSK